MRLSRRTTRHLICLTSVLAFASTPLLAQTGIDLLDAEQVLRAGESPDSSAGVTVKVALERPNGVSQATHEDSVEIRYDDGEFENFADNSSQEPTAEVGQPEKEWAQLFEVEDDSVVERMVVCFLRPEGDLSRSVDYTLRFYRNTTSNGVSYPGRQRGFSYNVEEDIRRPGDSRCHSLTGHLVGASLREGLHWVGIKWNPSTRKRLGGDYYTNDDMADVDRDGNAVFETEMRWRNLPVVEDAPNDGWQDPRGTDTRRSGPIKAIGVRLVLKTVHPDPEPPPTDDPDPDPDPTPEPDPDPIPEPDPDPGVIVPPPTGEGYTACRPTVAPLTLDGGIKVSLCYQAPNGDMDDARAVYQSDHSGLLYFFDDDNAEVFVKVLDGCGTNQHRWVYVAPLTDVAFNMYINDGRNPTWSYFNKAGDPGEIRTNLMAFPCAP